MRDFQFGRQRIFGHGKTVVLRSDFHAAGIQILHRLIRPAMAEFQLERFRSAGQRQQLMSQTDAEYRHLAEHAANRVDGVFQRLRIAGPVR